MNATLTLVVGVDELSPGTAWVATFTDANGTTGSLGSYGSNGTAKGAKTGRLSDWRPAARRAFRDLNLGSYGVRFGAGRMVPHGDSRCFDHAPQGVRITWEVADND